MILLNNFKLAVSFCLFLVNSHRQEPSDELVTGLKGPQVWEDQDDVI